MIKGPQNPSTPRNFTVDIQPTLLANQSVYMRVHWKRPRTEYPIERYRITWALYLHVNNDILNQSLIFNESSVSEVIIIFNLYLLIF